MWVTIRGEMCWLARGGTKVRNLGRAAKLLASGPEQPSKIEKQSSLEFSSNADEILSSGEGFEI
jgi:hypothetical protein